MRRLFTILVSVLISAGLFAQTPQKISYQAVIRDSNNALITNTTIGIQISILQGSSTGSTVYAETQNPTTNINGLASIEIGEGAVVSGTFATIDWSNDTYFIKTETDPSGSTNYTITGTSQILSVPYALHSKTAETLTGTISETDPIYNSSIASGITASDTANWNNKLAIETDPVFTSWDKSSGISISESQISDLNHFTSADETDPIYNSSIASSITASDTANWNNKLAIETDPVFTSWDKSSGISISESQISDLNHFTSANET
ncbi:MAG: hypothetical protein RBS07_15700, partial [Lentimicrobium sp.]|nr:hypothetical protein [Lentimicrobium sp.]